MKTLPWQHLFIIVDLNLPKRYDHGWTERRIASQLYIPQQTIYLWLTSNSHRGLTNNPTKITRLEGDCLELLKDIPELRDEALSLRYDYGWTERRIVDQLGGKKSTIHDWLVGNSHTPLVDNNGNIQHLEGDCLEILKDIPELRDEALSLRYDYGWTMRQIVEQLHIPIATIHYWLFNNSHSAMFNNIQHLEGDCLELMIDLAKLVILVELHPGPRANHNHSMHSSRW